jgi:hypothetical protein
MRQIKISSTKTLLKFAITGTVLLGSAILSAQFAPSASAFSLGDRGAITIYQNASDNPEGKSDVGRYFWVDLSKEIEDQQLDGLASLALFRVDSFLTVGGITSVNLYAKLFAGVDKYSNPLPNTKRFNSYRVSALNFSVGELNLGISDLGLELGQFKEFNLSFDLSSPSDRFTLSNFAVTYQNIYSNRLVFQGSNGIGVGEPVPEPLTILGTAMALGFGGLFQKEFSKRQKKLKLDR